MENYIVLMLVNCTNLTLNPCNKKVVCLSIKVPTPLSQ